ncbi:hypothetical protein MKW94_006507 [Papaver nudicaule]|uniref:Trichome birefringence-like N-terminal domain-containing protein n=1 Tax=Papaver nudicaule TaxID=74823 RepID=A0AA41SHR0_PAPNU|nr:hypothetical protein [Papaver nudicaule]
MSFVHILLCVLLISFLDDQAHGQRIVKHESTSCNVYQGSWVPDTSYPLYNASACPFLEREFNCVNNGRPDKFYLQYRWKPDGCKTPSSIKKSWFIWHTTWLLFNLMLHRSVTGQKWSTNNYLSFGGKQWLGVDTLIFNTWHWWLHVGRKQPWDLIQEGTELYKDMNRLVAYRKALSTWAKWVNTHVDPTKTQVFFQGVSPDHSNSSDWEGISGMNCYEETKPVMGSIYPAGEHPAQMVLKDVLKLEAKSVKLLDVTFLSQLRKDAHPSAYGFGGHRNIDCSHWCLAGVPDTWNQLLYASLVE